MAIGHLSCYECHGLFTVLYEDPRDPPVDEYDCLCADCHDYATDERVEELQEEIETLNANRKES